MSQDLKVFQLDNWEWWVGTSLAETAAAAKQHYGGDPDYEDARELSESELDRFTLKIKRLGSTWQWSQKTMFRLCFSQ